MGTSVVLPKELELKGQPDSVYRMQGSKHPTIILTFVALFLPVIVLGFLGLIIFHVEPKNGREVQPIYRIAFFAGIPIVLFGFFVLFKIARRMTNSYFVATYPEGLAYVKGSRFEFFPWKEMESVWQDNRKIIVNGVHTGFTHKYTIRRNDGKQIELNQVFLLIQELGDRIQEELLKQKVPMALSELTAGKDIKLGDFTVNNERIRYKSHEAVWEEVDRFNLEDGYLQVHKEGQWLNLAKVPVKKIPNIFVLVTLGQEILARKKT